jgi:hypothetical protein
MTGEDASKTTVRVGERLFLYKKAASWHGCIFVERASLNKSDIAKNNLESAVDLRAGCPRVPAKL